MRVRRVRVPLVESHKPDSHDYGGPGVPSQCALPCLASLNMLKVMEPTKARMTDDALVSRVEQAVQSNVSRDETLRQAVRLLKAERPHYNWVGIYLLEGDTLVLHNYVGKPTEHTHIPVGRGVCGTAVAERANQIVDDVTAVGNYLACSLETRAEIVVLIRRGDKIFGQIDIDSDTPAAFTATDEALLARVADVLASQF
jgi:putative methionine-R-sulfoxide reductase with GAF domain